MRDFPVKVISLYIKMHLKVPERKFSCANSILHFISMNTVYTFCPSTSFLFQDELKSRPRIASLLSSLRPVDATSPNMAEGKGGKSKKKKKANLGTIMGVYLPTVQNILGVILFLRLSWIVGIAGVGMAFFIVFLCCCSVSLLICTFCMFVQ